MMARRRIGQEELRLGDVSRRTGSLDEIGGLIDWAEIDRHLSPVYASDKGEQGWPPLAMVKRISSPFGTIYQTSSSQSRWTTGLRSAASAALLPAKQRRSEPPSYASGASWWFARSTGDRVQSHPHEEHSEGTGSVTAEEMRPSSGKTAEMNASSGISRG